MAIPVLADVPPSAERITAYDRQHLKTYLRLLDAEAAGASWQEAIRKLHGEDSSSDPARLERMHALHLARAKWVRDGGYLQLLPQSGG